MEAKYTVMTTKQTAECSHNPVLELRLRAICEAQAEITWPIARKAGYDEALGQLAEMTEECKQMGIREAVEWIEEQRVAGATLIEGVGYGIPISEEKYQAKRKDWGI